MMAGCLDLLPGLTATVKPRGPHPTPWSQLHSVLSDADLTPVPGKRPVFAEVSTPVSPGPQGQFYESSYSPDLWAIPPHA